MICVVKIKNHIKFHIINISENIYNDLYTQKKSIKDSVHKLLSDQVELLGLGDFYQVLATEIRGLKVYPSLKEIDRPVDMVEVFRKPEDLYEIAKEAIAINAKVLWGQIGVINNDAAKLAEDAGLKVVMNRCPKIELFRPFWKPRLDLKI